MLKPIFRGEPTPEQIEADKLDMAKCKCGRCTRSDESSDSSMASSDLN